MLRFQDRDVPLTSKETLIGRDPHQQSSEIAQYLKENDEKMEDTPQPRVHIPIDSCTKMSRIACRIFLDKASDLFKI